MTSADQRFEIMVKHMKEAGKSAINAPLAELEKLAYPHWVAMLHELLQELGEGCPCSRGMPQGCFLRLTPDEQKAMAQGDLSFAEFLSVVQQARGLALTHSKSLAARGKS